MLEVDGVSLSINGSRLFAPISLTVSPGSVASVMGPSGSGKSALLSFIAGVASPVIRAEGDVRVDRKSVLDLVPERRGIGLMFQDDLLFPHLSVQDNLRFGIPPSVDPRDRDRLVADALTEAELAGYGDRDPATLSGGQRTRIALMRTLLSQPRAPLLDEPFSRLDQELRGRIRGFVLEHALSRGLPVLLVTHDAEDAQAAGGPVISLTTD